MNSNIPMSHFIDRTQNTHPFVAGTLHTNNLFYSEPYSSSASTIKLGKFPKYFAKEKYKFLKSVFAAQAKKIKVHRTRSLKSCGSSRKVAGPGFWPPFLLAINDLEFTSINVGLLPHFTRKVDGHFPSNFHKNMMKLPQYTTLYLIWSI